MSDMDTEDDLIARLDPADGELVIAGLCCDSRQCRPGFLFAALPGVNADGADYIEQAIDNGAVAVLAPPGTALPHNAGGVVVVEDRNPRRRFALMASRFFARQPEFVAAVTGTNGKTSTVNFARAIWRALELDAASVGTLGIAAQDAEKSGAMTTPDPIVLHEELAELTRSGITHLAMEASSHGLEQHRLDGVRVRAAGFTNLSRDHLDYHGSMEDYLAAKARLFRDVLIPGGTAVLNADAPEFDTLKAICAQRGDRVLGYGKNGAEIRVLTREARPEGQHVTLSVMGDEFTVDLPLVGEFQLMNVLCALGLVLAMNFESAELRKKAVTALSALGGVRGRVELAGRLDNGAAVYVDYAHTPDALENVLNALRPHTAGKLHVLFGCGGDRDTGKRPQMGEIAARLADHVIVTDDNPRSEDPAAIRADIMAGCPDAENIGGRAEAIAHAVAALDDGDVLVVAGKGHEQGQIVGDKILPFDDVKQVQTAISELKGSA